MASTTTLHSQRPFEKGAPAADLSMDHIYFIKTSLFNWNSDFKMKIKFIILSLFLKLTKAAAENIEAWFVIFKVSLP